MAERRGKGDPGRLGYPAIDYGRGYGRDFGGGIGPREDQFGSAGRSWIDRPAAEDLPLAGPNAGKGPKGWKRSDERLREQLSERLMEDRLLDARGIEVSVADGVVTLAGEAASPAERVLAERLARESGGVREVVNELQVSPSTAPDPHPPLGARTGAMASPLQEGERDAQGREEGPRHFPTLSM